MNENLFDFGDEDITCKRGFSYRDIVNRKCEDWNKNQQGCLKCPDYLRRSASKVNGK